MASFPDDPDGEFGFKSWLVETGEGRASKGGFKMGGRQDPKERHINIPSSVFHTQEGSQRHLKGRELPSPDSPAAGVVAAFVEPVEAVGQVGSKPQQDLVGPASGQQGV